MNEQEELQKAFISYIAQKYNIKDENGLKQIISKLGEEGMKQLYQEFITQMQQQVKSAKQGAKLNYIKMLRGQCPEGYEMTYYKKGGQLCTKCAKKAEGAALEEKNRLGGLNARPIADKKGSKIVNAFKQDMAKKKTKKCEEGGIIDYFKCGGKTKPKKCQQGKKLTPKGQPIKKKYLDTDTIHTQKGEIIDLNTLTNKQYRGLSPEDKYKVYVKDIKAKREKCGGKMKKK